MPPRGPMSGPPHMGPPPMGMGPPGGFMPPGMGPPGMAGPPGAGPVGMPPRPPMGDDDGPPSKKAKTEDDLMPEQEFLRRNKVGHMIMGHTPLLSIARITILVPCRVGSSPCHSF